MREKQLTVGDFTEKFLENPESSSTVEMDAEDMSQNWRRCGISSDFIARYYSYFFPYREKSRERISRDTAENSISFVMNELIENTAKYSDAVDKSVQVDVALFEDLLVFQVSNQVLEETAQSFISMSQELMSGDPEELYVKKLEENVELESSGSGLGFLTLMNDYGVRLGFRFKKNGDSAYCITVQAKLPCREE